ncbi:unnamed protein product [Clonostachys rhizophaga]|uniref:Uncharacterized protein n=1 Tax=Clonostachys rhizophaga TaxID=160324 RepID=A0A9N9W6N8_9HYPO|nr:unnamed protein product [Clonostachys rhizophaga]
MERTGIITRLRRLGISSLFALFSGGAILTLVAVNGLVSPDGAFDNPAKNEQESRFYFGANYHLQVWLAIVGVAFGLLSYGFGEAYVHLFDWWCSRQAMKDAGLDYGRYLNSQPRAPVVYGLRGFPAFTTLRYFIVLASVAASIGYKFGIINVTTYAYDQVEPRLFELRLSPSRGLGTDGTPSPWFSDAPLGSNNQAFQHEIVYFNRSATSSQTDAAGMEPPLSIVMAGWARCSSILFNRVDSGYIYSREVVMVANLTEEEGDSFMGANDKGWIRQRTSSWRWFSDPPRPAVVEYRIVKPGQIQIQWARLGTWFSDPTSTIRAKVQRRLSYNIRYAVAEVSRIVSGSSCSGLSDSRGGIDLVRIFSVDEEVPQTEHSDGSLPLFRNWVDAIIYSEEATVCEGVGAFVRAVMAGWASEGLSVIGGPKIRHLRNDEEPFGTENRAVSWRSRSANFMDYPFYAGTRTGEYRGCRTPAAIVFLVLGVLAIAVAVARVFVGPPVLTSWTAQHVYLVKMGALSFEEKIEELETGYKAANVRLGKLRLKTGTNEDTKPLTSEYHKVGV